MVVVVVVPCCRLHPRYRFLALEEGLVKRILGGELKMETDTGYAAGANETSCVVAVAGVWSGDGHKLHTDNRGAVVADKAGA